MDMNRDLTVSVMENLLKHGKYNVPTRNAMENAVRLLRDQPEVMIRKSVNDGMEIVVDTRPLVLCKDCVHYEHCEIHDLLLNHENGFCADGERRDAD